jgi:hypothetical protein
MLRVPSLSPGRFRPLIVGGILVFLNAILSARPAVAQDRSRIWLGLGLGGAATTSEASGMALMGEVVYQTGPHHFAIRAMGAADPLGEDADEFGEIGALYGRAAKREWGHATVAAGLAVTGFGSCPDSASGGGCHTLGVPVVAEAALRLGSVAGIGAQGFANLNSKSVYGGLVFFLQLGFMPR